MLTLGVILPEDEDFVTPGVPEEWVEPLKALGFITVAKLDEVEKPGKLANDLHGYINKPMFYLSIWLYCSNLHVTKKERNRKVIL